MGNITKEERHHRMKTAALEKAICDGYEPDRLYSENGEVFMYLVDSEMDPVKISYTSDGHAMIDTLGQAYVMLSPSELRNIATTAKYAVAMWEEME